MRSRILAAAVLTAALTAPPFAAAQEQAPWFGTWKLDPARSTARPGPAEYKRVTFRIEPRDGGLKVIYDMVGTRGGRTHLEWSGSFDGRDHPVQGVDYVLTNAYRRIDDRTYELLVKVDGRLAATTRASVSPDGEVLTAVTTEEGGGGAKVTTTAVYARQRDD